LTNSHRKRSLLPSWRAASRSRSGSNFSVRPSSPEKSDRLNTYLNIRLAEYDALRMYGGVPAWNPIMFGGFSVAALHWMKSRHRPALCYGLSVLGVHRIAQVDNAYLTLVLLPAAMLAIRRI
jgi:hypothetical protein